MGSRTGREGEKACLARLEETPQARRLPAWFPYGKPDNQGMGSINRPRECHDRGFFAKNFRGRGSNPKTGFERLSSRSAAFTRIVQDAIRVFRENYPNVAGTLRSGRRFTSTSLAGR